MSLCAFVICPLLFPSRGGWDMDFKSSKCKIDQVDITDWMSFLQSNLMKGISPNPEALSAYA